MTQHDDDVTSLNVAKRGDCFAFGEKVNLFHHTMLD